MALTDKNIVITPNIGQTADPKIVFSGADASTGPQNITLQVYPTNNGTLSFEGSNGQLFSVNNNFTGTIFSVNDISGIPSIEVLDTGEVRLAQYSGFVHIPNTTNATNTTSGALQVDGGVGIGGNTWIGGNLTVIGLITGNVSLSGTITTASNIALGTAGQLIYQSAAGITAFHGPGTPGQILISNGTSGPSYTSTASIYVNSSVYAEEIRGGTVGQLLYQSAASTTNYAGPGTAGQLLVSQGANAAGPVFTNTASIYVGNSVSTEKILGGVAGAVVYQSGANATGFSGAGTTGQVLLSGGTGTPTWSNTLNLAGTTAATSTSTGALIVAGGAGIGGNLYVGGTLYATVSGNITTATNIAGGATGSILMQTAAGTTGFIGIGTNGYTLKSNGTTATWVDPATMVSGIANTATNIAGGAANQIPYQSAAGITTFSSNFTYNGTNLTVTGGLVTANSFVPAGSAVPTNGMYLPAANTLSFATNSTGNRIYINSAGQVGVNTNGPGVTFDVNGDIRTNSILYASGTANATGAANSTGALRVAGGAGINNDLYVGGSVAVGGSILNSFRSSVSTAALGTTAGNQTLGLNLYSSTTNGDYLEFTNTRARAGSDWQSAGWRLQQKVDSTWMGWMQFNGGSTTGNNSGISWGTGSSTAGATSVGEQMRLDASGNLVIGSQTSPTGSNGLYVAGAARVGANSYVYADNQGITVRTGTGNYGVRIYPGGGTNANDAILQFTNAAQNTQLGSVFSRDGTGFYAGSDVAVPVYIKTAGVTRLTVDTNGNGFFTGDVYSSYSDINLKTVLGQIEDPLVLLRKIDVFYYEPNEEAIALGATPGRKVGVSAQSVLAVQPEAVGRSALNSKYLTVQYERLVPLLIESVKKLEDLVAAQEEKIKELTAKLEGKV